MLFLLVVVVVVVVGPLLVVVVLLSSLVGSGRELLSTPASLLAAPRPTVRLALV